MLARGLRRGQGGAKRYVDDVFSTWLYKGNSSTQSITTGHDIAGKGGSVHIKGRRGTQGAASHRVTFTALGAGNFLRTDSDLGLASEAGLTAFGASGFSLGSAPGVNDSGTEYTAWSFVDADKFHAHQVVTKSAGSNATVSFPNLGTLGKVRVKRTGVAGSWYVWHRSLSAGQLLIGESTAAAATLGHVTVSGTTVTLVNGVIADGQYLVEAWAHDTSPDGIIQCGSFTTDGSGNATVTLGWEPQLVDIKSSSTTDQWYRADNMRGMTADGVDNLLYLNQSWSESSGTLTTPKSTGFAVTGRAASSTYIYLAIRRPNKPPTTGTQVYKTSAPNESGSFPCVQTGWPVDFGIIKINKTTTGSNFSACRLVGELFMYTDTTAAESADSSFKWDSNIGWLNLSGANLVAHSFRRAPGVFDQICYNGTGANKTEPHTLLGVPPELWRAKRRNGAGSWVYGSSLLAANEKVICPSPNGRVADATVWNGTYPTASQISLGTHADVNAAGGTYLLEMWATLPGVSKVGKIVGNGTSQNIECGFSAGARFVMIIRMTAGVAQDIYVWDTARGIVAANDPHLSLNTTAAEVTTDDSLDPYAGGFAINQNSATNINVNGAEYLFLAYA